MRHSTDQPPPSRLSSHAAGTGDDPSTPPFRVRRVKFRAFGMQRSACSQDGYVAGGVLDGITDTLREGDSDAVTEYERDGDDEGDVDCETDGDGVTLNTVSCSAVRVALILEAPAPAVTPTHALSEERAAARLPPGSTMP